MSIRSANTVRLMQFDLSRRDRRQALGSHDSRKFYEVGLPALVDERARERRLSVEISNDSVLFLGISGWQSDLGAFFGLGDGSDFEMFLQDLAAPLMNHPRSGSDMCVVVRSDILHEKIDKPPLLLKEREESHDLRFRLVRGLGEWRDWDGGEAGPAAGTGLGVVLPFGPPSQESVRMRSESTSAIPAIGAV